MLSPLFPMNSSITIFVGGPDMAKYVLILGALFIGMGSFAAEVKPKYGPKGNPKASPVGVSHEYFQNKNNPSPDYWALTGYYVPQFNGYSCSAATVAMVLNAARLNAVKSADDKVILQPDLLKKVKAEHWEERLSKPGFRKEHGVSLDILGKVTEASFKAYGFDNVSVKVVHLDSTSSDVRSALIAALKENEKSAGDFIIANFNQQAFTDDAEAGHIAPVGAYDAETDRVLIMDPDREYYEPYWISVDNFIVGMATKDKSSALNRGYVWVKVGQPAKN